MIDCMIGVAVKALCNLFSCKADAGTWISRTRGSGFGELGSAGKLKWKEEKNGKNWIRK